MTEHKRAYMRAYREKNKDKLKEYNKTYMKEYYKLHKEKIIEKATRYNLLNIDKHRQSCRKWAKKAYKEAKENIEIGFYKLPIEVTILDNKHIEYCGNTYNITRKGYLTCGSKLFHVEYSKYLGIWFSGCEIHHIDGNVFNNLEDNLIALTPEKHRYAHSLLKENKKQYYDWIEKQKVGQ